MPLARMLALSNSGMADTAVSSIIQGRDRIAAYSGQRLLAPAKSLRGVQPRADMVPNGYMYWWKKMRRSVEVQQKVR